MPKSFTMLGLALVCGATGGRSAEPHTNAPTVGQPGATSPGQAAPSPLFAADTDSVAQAVAANICHQMTYRDSSGTVTVAHVCAPYAYWLKLYAADIARYNAMPKGLTTYGPFPDSTR